MSTSALHWLTYVYYGVEEHHQGQEWAGWRWSLEGRVARGIKMGNTGLLGGTIALIGT
jgi:hypothetical protein